MNPVDFSEMAAALFHEAGDALFLFDPDSDCLADVNPLAARLTGLQREELLKLKLGELIRAESDLAGSRLRHATEHTTLFHARDGYLLRTAKPGEWVPVNLSIARLHLKVGPRTLITARDLREQRAALLRIQKVESELRRVLGAVPDGLWSARRRAGRWEYRYLSTAFTEILGRTEEVLRAEGWNRFRQYIHPEDRNRIEGDLRSGAARGNANRECEYRIIRPDGSVRHVRQSLRVTRSPGGRPVRVDGVLVDVTDRRRLEEQLARAGRMEAVGRLAGGVAHHFNNLLTAVVGNAALARESLPHGHPAMSPLAACEEASARAADLTGQLLLLARGGTPRPEPTGLARPAAEAVALIRGTTDPRICVELSASAELWPAFIDPGQASQLFLALCVNARDAMPEGGRLTIRLDNAVVDETTARECPDGQLGEFVRLAVSDTGRPVPADVLPRVFEPFTISRPGLQSTGLGLAGVYSIARQSGGWARCRSSEAGVVFEVYLPRAPRQDAAPRPLPPSIPRGTGQLILLADDEPTIRSLGRLILEQHGYRVVLAADGREAVELHSRHRGEIAVAILDLTMPGMSGREAMREMLHLEPELPVVLCSGYAADELSSEELDRARGFVPKPYRPRDLTAAVRAALDGN